MNRVLDSTGPVELASVPEADVVAGTPRAGSRSLTTVGDAEVGVWVMTTGVAADTEVDEVFVVIEGSATIDFDDGETLEVGPGSVVRLRAGERAVWTVHTELRKIYVV